MLVLTRQLSNRPRSGPRTKATVIALASTGLLGLPAAASGAGSATVESGKLVFTDAPGSAAQIRVAKGTTTGQVILRNSAAGGVGAGAAGCTATAAGSGESLPGTSAERVVCDGVTSIRLQLGDGNDELGRSPQPGSAIDVGLRIVIHGGPGDDDVIGGNRSDSLFGEGGNDTLTGGFGDDTINGGDDDDHVVGDAGDDTLIGGLGDDTLSGGAGYDLLDADGSAVDNGSDRIDGGDDIDIVSYGSRGLADIRIDQANGVADDGAHNEFDNIGSDVEELYTAGGDDRIVGASVYSEWSSNVTRTAGGDDVITAGGGRDVIFPGAGDDTVNAGGSDDRVEDGEGGDDTIDGGDGDDWLYGFQGRDTLSGAGGNDMLFGGAGRDEIDGGSGTDTVDGEAGGDILDGGPAPDTIIGGDGSDYLWIRDQADDVADCGLGIDVVIADVLPLDALGVDCELRIRIGH